MEQHPVGFIMIIIIFNFILLIFVLMVLVCFLEEESLKDSLESLLLEVQIQTSEFPLVVDVLDNRLALAQDTSGSERVERKYLWNKRFPFSLVSSLAKVRQNLKYNSVFLFGRLRTSWRKRQRHKIKNAFLEPKQVGHKELASRVGMYLVLQLVLLWFQIRIGKVKFLDLRACVDHSLSP